MTGHTVQMEAPNEWARACQIQQRFMQRSRSTVDGLDYSAQCRQVHALGGDFYDFVPLAQDRLAVAVGDASGKGLAAALMVANVQSSLRTASLFAGNDGPAVLEAVNRQVYEASLADRYATLFYSVFDALTHTLRYVNAGHNPPILIHRTRSATMAHNGRPLRYAHSNVLLEAGGAPVGMFPTWQYEEGAVELRPGDVLLAYTDGVTEATNPEGEEWGLEGIQEAVAKCGSRSSHEMVQGIFARLDEYTDGLQTDDATVMVLQVLH